MTLFGVCVCVGGGGGGVHNFNVGQKSLAATIQGEVIIVNQNYE